MAIQEFHGPMSFLYQGPILQGVITVFWADSNAEIRCLENVFSYYFSPLGVFAAIFGFEKAKCTKAMMLCGGWAVCYFPFFLISPVVYHYYIPLVIGTMTFGACLDLFAPAKIRQIVAVAVIVSTTFGFWLWSPYTYGTKMHELASSIWSRTWIDGNTTHQSRRKSYWELQAKSSECRIGYAPDSDEWSTRRVVDTDGS
jgi:dolichyl-phosphate-mannose--protein O-mannosyl transferase